MIMNRLTFAAYSRNCEKSKVRQDCKLENIFPIYFSIPPPMQSHYGVEMEE